MPYRRDRAHGMGDESADASDTERSPAEIRAEGNRLKDEPSLYLRQHGHNPMDWYPWSDEALARAKQLDRPIFLSIGYSACHWCHVMEEEVFGRDEVAAYMNSHFVSIKVDREERPDLDAVYMEAVQALTGQGGWPMSVFLTSELKPFYGGTYFPRDRFLSLARGIVQAYGEKKDLIAAQSAALDERLSAMDRAFPGPTVDAAAIDGAAAAAWDSFDARSGGMRGRMKFPTPVLWTFLLHHYRKTGDDRYAKMVRVTLDAMASGGIHDHVGGGFHRYTVDDVWLVPHFEKMLYDNAQIASLYLEAAAVFDDERYAGTARDVLNFMARDMSDPAGPIYASFDADSGGEEGSFYVWTPEEIVSVAGADGLALARLLGVSAEGNFAGRNVLTRRVDPAKFAAIYHLTEDRARGLFDAYREALYATRAGRAAPGLDRKVVTSWNGLAIEAFARGYAALRDPRYLEQAERAADFLWSRHRDAEGNLVRASTDGVTVGAGMLDDYAFFARGLLELYQASGNPVQLERAFELTDRALALFADPNGGFYLMPEGHAAPLGRKADLFDQAAPSGSSVLLAVLLRVAALTGNQRTLDRVDAALASHGDLIRKAGREMAGWLDAAEQRNGPFCEVVVVGDAESARTADLIAVFRKVAPPHAVMIQVPGDGPDARLLRLLPPLAGKRTLNGRPTAYLCRFGTCDSPTTDPAALKAAILNGWAH